ncbi:MAG: DUF262 domain-containing protein [Methanoregula sp.]|jgi:uncharacterized protein with ParB-like and HNH nuclease domain
MDPAKNEVREIRGDSLTIRQLLDGQKYAIDYYQREYKWKYQHVEELLSDLSSKFLFDYQDSHDREMVERYGHYFLGSIIISKKDGKEFIIDGQQRLTTLTLLLIYLHHLQNVRNDAPTSVENMIFSTKFAKKSFNLDVPEREACMHALYEGDESFNPVSANSEAVTNIWNRYYELDNLFPEDLKERALPFFVDWLLENVHLVKITAYSDADAYTVFETMNDRGLSLTATEMLKGYLLSKIEFDERKTAANAVWKKHITDLKKLGEDLDWKDLDADFIKTWLRSHYSQNIRQRKKGALPEDWDKIGTEFHRWVRGNAGALGLDKSSDYFRFIEKDFEFYSRQYQKIVTLANTCSPGSEHIFYNAHNRFTLQYQLLLAPLLKTDPDEIVLKKIRMVAKYVDILISRRMMNFRAIDYNTMQYAMFVLMKDIRGVNPDQLAEILTSSLAKETEVVGSKQNFSLTKTNRKNIQYLLARITDFIEIQSGSPSSRFIDYISGEGTKKFEVEHIWANHYDQHSQEFDQIGDFESYRNRFGDLLLLQKSFNASYNDLPYKEKREYYPTQNLLVRSLHPIAYERNPGFLQWIGKTGLPFHPIDDFTKSDIDSRGILYYKIGQMIWDPAIIKQEL